MTPRAVDGLWLLAGGLLLWGLWCAVATAFDGRREARRLAEKRARWERITTLNNEVSQ